MGKIPHVRGAYVSAGHNCWGILWAPVSGKSMSELIVDGKASCVDLKRFSVTRTIPYSTNVPLYIVAFYRSLLYRIVTHRSVLYAIV